MRSLNFKDGRTGASFKFEQMVKEETEILYAFKGAYSYTDLQNMTEYELMLIYEAYKDIKEIEKIVFERTKESDGGDIGVITLPNSRFNVPDE